MEKEIKIALICLMALVSLMVFALASDLMTAKIIADSPNCAIMILGDLG